MIVTNSKGIVRTIKILSIFMIPFSIFMIIACFFMLVTTDTVEEKIAAVVFLVFFLPVLGMFLSLASKAYKKNQKAIMIEGHEIVIDLGYKVLRFPITSIEYFSHRTRRGITVVKFKVKSKRIKRILCLSDEKEIIKFDRYINGRIGKY